MYQLCSWPASRRTPSVVRRGRSADTAPQPYGIHTFRVGVTHPKLAGEEPAPSLARGGAQRRMGCGPLLRSRSHCATVTAKLQPIIPAFHTPCGPSGHLPRFAEKGGSSAACRLDGLCERGSPQPETTDRAVKSMKKHSSWRMGLSSVETASRAVLRTRCAGAGASAPGSPAPTQVGWKAGDSIPQAGGEDRGIQFHRPHPEAPFVEGKGPRRMLAGHEGPSRRPLRGLLRARAAGLWELRRFSKFGVSH